MASVILALLFSYLLVGLFITILDFWLDDLLLAFFCEEMVGWE